ncbi:MAG: hypothetical protein C4342_06220, partial [Armatimonadota bacterium]
MRTPILLGLTLVVASLAAQGDDLLTLDEALRHARESNGSVAAAWRQYVSARSAVALANANFWPIILPTYRYVDQEQRFAGGIQTTGRLSFNQVSLSAQWLVLDGGQRLYALERAKKTAEATLASTRQTVRQVLFSTVTQFYELLRAQELLRVADAQVARAEQTLDATRRRVEQGTAPRKDILQA